MPERVGFIPVFLITKSEPFTIKPATIKNAAEEISPTTLISFATICDGVIVIFVPSVLISASRYTNNLSVWSLET